jgi:nucleoside-diphosphate-sugar epimerase
VARGHQVIGMTRSPDRAAGLTGAGAEAAVADALDREAVIAAVAAARPEVVVHQLTSLARLRSMRRFDDEFAVTNRLRSEGTQHLIEAARSAGARRLVAQSYAGWPYERAGGPARSETDPLDPDPPRTMRRSLAAIRALEAAVLGAGDLEGVVLRYGAFYGPGTSIAPGSDIAESVRRRRFPIVGSGGGVWSFIHIDDAASATAAAIEAGPPGIYNIVDDEPAPVRDWLPALADALGARPPHRVPAWVGRLVIGAAGTSLMTAIRGASNARAARDLGWRPAHSSWRQGFRHLSDRAGPG